MTPRKSIVGIIAGHRWFRTRRLHRGVFATLILLSGLLALFPERYRAAASLTPTDPSSMGLSGTLGQLGAFNSIFTNQAAVEVALKVARSIYVRDLVIRRLDLGRRLDTDDPVRLHRWLEREVTVRILRGGIIQFECYNREPELAKQVIATYANATRERLAEISRRQTAYKRDVLIKLVSDAADRLVRARGAYDAFRLETRFAVPQNAIVAAEAQVSALEAAVKAKEVELNTVRQFATDQNIAVQQVRTQLETLRQQLAAAKATNPADNSIGKLVRASTAGERLLRELNIAQSLYDAYMRFLEGTAVEDLTSTANIRVLEPAYVDSERQVDWRFVAITIALALLWAAIELYRLRLPAGDGPICGDPHA